MRTLKLLLASFLILFAGVSYAAYYTDPAMNTSFYSFAHPSTGHGFYFGFHAGGMFPSDIPNLETGYNAGGQVGYYFGSLRVEEAGSYFNNDINFVNGNVHTVTVMTNAYYDFFKGFHITPYIGGGIGWFHAIENIRGLSGNASRNEFAYQGIAGVAYHFNKHVSLGVEYRILSWTDNGGSFYNIANAVLNFYF